ncbi:MAG: hypothetical protein ACI8ZB_001032 [Desulforhopalus sp.]|jgi:hypothetical protein
MTIVTGENMKRLSLITALLMAILILPVASELQAATVMKSGTVTAAPWFDRYFKIRIDGIVYMFMPTVQIDAYFTDYDSQEMTSYLAKKFRVGDKLTIAKQGFRIYRVEFLDK